MTETNDTPVLVKRLHQAGKVQERSAEPIDFVDHHAVDPAGLDVGQEPAHSRPIKVAALTPYNEQLVIGAANADTTYFQAMQSAAAAYRTAEYAAIGVFELADRTARASAVAAMAAQQSYPWLQYRAQLEAARRDAFANVEQGQLVVLGSSINLAETTYKNAISVFYINYFTTVANSETPYLTALANRDLILRTSTASIDAAFEHSLADTDEAWHTALASANRNDRVSRQSAERNFVANGNATTRDSALAASAATFSSANTSAAHAFTVADVTARGTRHVGRTQAMKTRAQSAAASTVATEQAEEVAYRVFFVGAWQAQAVKNIAIAEALASFETIRTQALADAVTAAAQGSTNPWLIRDATILQAQATYTATVEDARVDLITIQQNAARDRAIAEAYAVETLGNARSTARAERSLARADADLAAASDDAVTALALSQVQSYISHEQLLATRSDDALATGEGGLWINVSAFAGRATPKPLAPSWENHDRIELGIEDFTPGQLRDEVRQINFDFAPATHITEIENPDTSRDFEGRIDDPEADADTSRQEKENPTFEDVWKKFKAQWSDKSWEQLLSEFIDGVEEGFVDGFKDTVALVKGAGGMVGGAFNLSWKMNKVAVVLANPLLYEGSKGLGYDPLAEELATLNKYKEKFQTYATDAIVKGTDLWERRQEIADQLVLKATEIAGEIEALRRAMDEFLKLHGREFINAVVHGDLETINSLASQLPPKAQEAINQVASFAASIADTLVDQLQPRKLGYVVGQMLYEALEDAVISAAWSAATALTLGANGVTGAPLIAARIANFSRKIEKYSDKLGGQKVIQQIIDKVQSAMWATLKHADMCFVAGTLVHTREGLRPIEEIRTGDEVASRPEGDASSTPRWRRVLNTVVTRPNRLYHVTYRLVGGVDETLTGTGEHPFWVVGRSRFVPASELEIGDELLGSDQSTAKVVAIRVEDATQSHAFTTYNFEVENDHTYLVGHFGAWVHNNSDKVCDFVAHGLFSRLGKEALDGLPTDKLLLEIRKEVRERANKLILDSKGSIAFSPYELAQHEKDVLAKLRKIQGPKSFNRKKVLEGFQDHHIISDKNAFTNDHELLRLAEFDLQSRKNKIFLPETHDLHPMRSIHDGKHLGSVSRNLADQMDAVVEAGKELGYSTADYKRALGSIISGERQMLRTGRRALNKNRRPWAK